MRWFLPAFVVYRVGRHCCLVGWLSGFLLWVTPWTILSGEFIQRFSTSKDTALTGSTYKYSLLSCRFACINPCTGCNRTAKRVEESSPNPDERSHDYRKFNLNHRYNCMTFQKTYIHNFFSGNTVINCPEIERSLLFCFMMNSRALFRYMLYC